MDCGPLSMILTNHNLIFCCGSLNALCSKCNHTSCNGHGCFCHWPVSLMKAVDTLYMCTDVMGFNKICTTEEEIRNYFEAQIAALPEKAGAEIPGWVEEETQNAKDFQTATLRALKWAEINPSE